MLVIHNERDYRCPFDDSIGAFNILQVKGVPSKFLCFSDEVSKQKHCMHLYNFPTYLLNER